MKKTNIHRHLGLLSETYRFEDPWGVGLTIEIYPEHHKPWQDWLLDQQKANPAVVKAINAQISGTSPELDAEDIEKLMKAREHMKEGLALHRIKTIEGVAEVDDETGEETAVDYTQSVGLDLLRFEDTLIPGDLGPKDKPLLPHGGKLFGDALADLIVERGAKLESFRADEQQVAEGNS